MSLASALSRLSSSRSPVARFLSSTVPLAIPRGPITSCQGRPIRSIEASHDEAGIIWPEPVAPWQVGLVTMRADDEPTVAAADDLYAKLGAAGVETLYDDRDERGGAKLASMDLIGLPWQLVVGPRGIASGTVELKKRATGEREELSIESALARLTA